MTAKTAPEVPEWIYPGAEVILYTDDHSNRDDPSFRTATVGKLAKLSFTVTFEGNVGQREERIYTKDLASKDQGSSWNRWRYRVIEKGSAEADSLAMQRARRVSRDRAIAAARRLADVNADRDDLTLIREAIVALSKHGDLVLKQDTENPIHRADSSKGMTRCGKSIDAVPYRVRYIDKGVTCADCKENGS